MIQGGATLIDSKLYLPKSWASDKQRLEKAKEPLGQREFKTKQELALEIINHRISLGTRFDYIGGDALYGVDQKLTDAFDAMAIPFLMDIRENQYVYLEGPQIRGPNKNRTVAANQKSLSLRFKASGRCRKRFSSSKDMIFPSRGWTRRTPPSDFLSRYAGIFPLFRQWENTASVCFGALLVSDFTVRK